MDEIQSKLNQLDKRLEGFGGLVKERIAVSPILFVAAGLISGVIVQNTFNMPLWCWCVLLGLLFFTALILAYKLLNQLNRGNIKNTVPLAMAVLLCAFCLGAIRLISYRYAEPNNIRNFVKDKPILATIRGTVISDPRFNNKSDWKFAKFTHSDPVSSFYLKLTQAESIEGWAEIKGIIRVQVNQPVFDLHIGDRIEAYCILEKFKNASNPGQFCSASHFARNNIYATAVIGTGEAISILNDRDNSFFIKFRNKVRQIASRAVLGDISYSDENIAMLEALLLGQRTNIDSKTYRAFEKTGLLHFISLSGMHLGIIVAVFWWFGKLFGLLKPARAVVCMAAVALFLVVVPPRPPTVRAAIICFVFGFSILFSRKADSLNSLSLAAVILLLIRPTSLFEPGWQLSFSAVLGILLISNPIISYFKINPNILIAYLNSRLGIFRPIVFFIFELFAVGIGAWFASAGILLYHFYAINLFTSLWTILAFPFVAAILTIGFLKAIFWFLLPSLSNLLGVALYFLSSSLIWIVKLFSQIPLNEILVGNVPLVLIAAYYIFLVFFAWVYFQNYGIKKISIITMTVIVVVFAFGGKLNNNGLILTCLDVGHGQAVVLQTPKQCFIFDAGSQYNNDIGTRIIRPFLRYQGIKQIDAIIISHDDIDHINGIPEIATGCPVKSVFSNLGFINESNEWGTAKYLTNLLAKEGLAIKPLAEKLDADKNLNISILWPDEGICKDEDISDNNKSTVSLIEFAGRKILICSDIESVAQQQLQSRFKNLSADIVMAPHHGSKNTTTDTFLGGLGAEYLICSSGRRYYQRLQNIDNKTEGEWFYTARDGAVSVRISKKGQISIDGFINE